MLRKSLQKAAAFLLLALLAVPIAVVTYVVIGFLQLAGDGALMLLGLASAPTPGAWFVGALLALPAVRIVDRRLTAA